MIFSIEKIMFDRVSNQYSKFQVEKIWEIFRYIDYYKVKNFDRVMNENVDIVLNNRLDYFEIVEDITLVRFTCL